MSDYLNKPDALLVLRYVLIATAEQRSAVARYTADLLRPLMAAAAEEIGLLDCALGGANEWRQFGARAQQLAYDRWHTGRPADYSDAAGVSRACDYVAAFMEITDERADPEHAARALRDVVEHVHLITGSITSFDATWSALADYCGRPMAVPA